MSNYTALLPMKAHSERVPGKNFKDFNGKPLFEWILETLISLNQVSRIIINTDAVDKLLGYEICHNAKVNIRQRDEEIVGDFVSMNKVIQNDIEFCGDDYYLMTHTTNPLITKNTFETAFDEFEESLEESFDSLFSCNEYRARFYDKKSVPINHNPLELIRTQDLDPIYEENSCLYLFSKESFEKTGARIGFNPKVFVTPEWESIDIDDQKDWEKAIFYQQILNNK